MILMKGLHAMKEAEDFYTIREAAQLLQVSEATVWRWAEAERLPAYRVGRRIRIPKQGLQAMVRPMGSQSDDFEKRGGIWAGYDPVKALEAIEAGFGALAGVDIEQLLADLRAEREQDTPGRRW